MVGFVPSYCQRVKGFDTIGTVIILDNLIGRFTYDRWLFRKFKFNDQRYPTVDEVQKLLQFRYLFMGFAKVELEKLRLSVILDVTIDTADTF